MASRHFVYILQSVTNPSQYYVGSTSNPERRLAAHNAGDSPHTSRFRPWYALLVMDFANADRARAFEAYLKSGSGREFARRHFR
jgi:predicted GIY-YIG superfamily endonuclease